jgi:hypothetical protein
MDEDRKALIQKMWNTTGRFWPFQGDTMYVPLPVSIADLASPPDYSAPPVIPRLAFRRGIEFNDEKGWKRYYVECEGIRVDEYTRPL